MSACRRIRSRASSGSQNSGTVTPEDRQQAEAELRRLKGELGGRDQA
jgi:hypothetical protein